MTETEIWGLRALFLRVKGSDSDGDTSVARVREQRDRSSAK